MQDLQEFNHIWSPGIPTNVLPVQKGPLLFSCPVSHICHLSSGFAFVVDKESPAMFEFNTQTQQASKDKSDNFCAS